MIPIYYNICMMYYNVNVVCYSALHVIVNVLVLVLVLVLHPVTQCYECVGVGSRS